MNLVKVTPFDGMNRTHQLMSLFLKDAFFRSLPDNDGWGRVHWPIPDVYETDDGLVVTMEIPGFEKNEINVMVNKGFLEVKGERHSEGKENRMYYHAKRWRGCFEQSFKLPPDVDSEKVSANLKNGVLSVTFSKMEKTKLKQIAVKVN